MKSSVEHRTIICEAPVGIDAPTRVLILPWGNVVSTRGSFTVDEESVRLIVEDFKSRRIDMLFDYEHQSLGGEFASPDGRAPAAGWIKALEAVPGEGIYAQVEWTDRAKEFLQAKEYRYLSPVVGVRKKDQKAVLIITVGLTNTPAISGIPAIVNADGGKSPMNEHEQLLAKLKELAPGLAADADEAAVIKALKNRLAKPPAEEAQAEFRAAVCKVLGLKDDADAKAVAEAIASIKKPAPTDPSKYVDADVHAQALKRIEALESRQTSFDADAWVAQAYREGRLCEGQEKAYRELYLKDAALAKQILGGVPEGKYPKVGGAVTPATLKEDNRPAGREGIIARACAKFGESAELQAFTSKAGYANDQLTQAGMKELTKDEREKLVA